MEKKLFIVKIGGAMKKNDVMKKTVREIVIDSLLKEKGMELRSVNEKIKKGVSINVSYHSVYKAIRQLIDEGVILKKEKEYFLSEKWAREQVESCHKIKEHLKGIYGEEYASEGPISHTFKNIKELHKFLTKLEYDHLRIFDNVEKGTIIWVMYHCYNYLLQPAKELAYLKKLKEHNMDLKILCYGNSVLDERTKSAFEKFGATTITDSKVGGLTGMNIYGDMVVEIYYDKEFLDVLNEIYMKTKTITDFDPVYFFEKLDGIDYSINVVVYKNINIVKCLKERALEFFGSKT